MNVREERKLNALTKTGEITLNNGNYELNKQYQSTTGSFNQQKPPMYGITVNPEISSVRNQLKLIKAKKNWNTNSGEEQVDKQMEQINNDINDINQMVKAKSKEPVYASKPMGSRNRSIPLRKTETQPEQNEIKYEPLQYNPAPITYGDTQKIPLKNRILKSDQKQKNQEKLGGLYFPEEKESKQEFKQEPMNLKGQFQEKEDDLYVPSVQETKEVKRQTLPGGKNLNEEKPLIVEKSLEEQLREAEIKNELLKEEELIECSAGCGRSFKPDVYEKHVKVCKNVFQTKRKEFNSKAHRIVNGDQQKLARQGQIKEKLRSTKNEQKWKEQSEGLRNIISNTKVINQINKFCLAKSEVESGDGLNM